MHWRFNSGPSIVAVIFEDTSNQITFVSKSEFSSFSFEITSPQFTYMHIAQPTEILRFADDLTIEFVLIQFMSERTERDLLPISVEINPNSITICHGRNHLRVLTMSTKQKSFGCFCYV